MISIAHDRRILATAGLVAGGTPRKPAQAGGRPNPVVHLLGLDPPAARRLARLFGSAGFETLSHADKDRLPPPGSSAAASCAVIDAAAAPSGQLRALCSSLPVIATAGRGEVATAVQAMKAGAVDCLAQPFAEEEILEAVLAALEADQERRTSASAGAALRSRFETLTRREREVMGLVTAGKMNKQVAGDLGLSEITVKVHRGAAMRKMGARTFADLVRMADAVADGPPGECLALAGPPLQNSELSATSIRRRRGSP